MMNRLHSRILRISCPPKSNRQTGRRLIARSSHRILWTHIPGRLHAPSYILDASFDAVATRSRPRFTPRQILRTTRSG